MGATSSRLIILLGVLLSVAAIGYGLYKIQTEERAQQAALPAPQPAAVEAPEPPRVVEILAAARPIARGQLVVPADLATIPVVGAAPPGAFTVAEEAIGQTAVVDIAARQLILEQSLSPHPADAGLAAAIPAGYRAVGIRTNAEIAAGNYVKPGDRVDIAIVLAETVVPGGGQAGGGDGRGDLSKANLLLQDVPVLSVGPLLTANPVQASPDGDSAGRLIESAGWKGRRLGSAAVSDKHANFIQADPDGSADDVVALMTAVRDAVLDHSGVRLVAETVLVGFGDTGLGRSAVEAAP